MSYLEYAYPKDSYNTNSSGGNGYNTLAPAPTYLVTPTDSASLDPAEIARRILYLKARFFEAKPFLPDHPAVTLVEDFLNHKLIPISVSDKNTITTEGSRYLSDLRRLPEAQQTLKIIRQSGAALLKGQVFDCSRHLADQSIFQQLLYPAGFLSDLYNNTTRALLGSFAGKGTVSAVGASYALVTFTVTNALTWESLTRCPPAMAGYSAGNSYVPDVPGWRVNTDFEWREIIKFE